MQAGLHRSNEYVAASSSPLSTGWLQAGFSSFAYRLAHLTVPRGVAIFGAGLMFYLF
jgi:hypothetical protein